MPLTDDQCQKLCEAILNVYPYENKAALESLLIKEFNVNLEFTVSYSDLISANDLNKTIQKDHKKRNTKIKILFFQTEPKNLNLNKEFSEIESAIKRASNRSLFNKPIFKSVSSTDDIRQAIANENPQIVHFCGHALEDGSLKLENDSNESLVSPEILKSIFEGREDIIKCVLLNACHSAKATVAISHHIDYAIGMNDKIIDEVAIEFAKGFYDGLGVKNNNKDIDIFLRAFNEGIRAIIAKNNSQKLIPVLKKRIRYEDAILNLIKNINTENKIDEFIGNLKSLPNLSSDRLFTKFYVDYSYPIKKDNLNQFLEILRGIEKQNLAKIKSAYRKTLPEYSTIDNSELNNPDSIDYIIDILRTEYPFVTVGDNKVPSILVFAKNLADEFQEIKTWVKEVSKKLCIIIPVAPEHEGISNTNKKTFLFIIISPEDQKFRLEAEFILDENQQSKPQPFDFKETLKTPIQLNSDDEADNGKGVRCDSDEEIPSMIEGIISTFMSQFKEQISKPIIEIFLPYKYLGRNLDDEWRIKDDFDTKIAIVQEYQIILHPLERFTGSQSYKNFQDSWSEFKQFLETESITSLIVEDVEKIHKIDKNYRKIGTSLKKKKCVKLTSPLSPLPQTEQENFWRGVLIGGTPLVFWIHTDKQINLNDTDAYLTKEYLNNNFQNFIDEMCNIRQDAYDDEDNKENKLGYHLGFLCDHPNRIPTIKAFKSF